MYFCVFYSHNKYFIVTLSRNGNVHDYWSTPRSYIGDYRMKWYNKWVKRYTGYPVISILHYILKWYHNCLNSYFIINVIDNNDLLRLTGVHLLLEIF